MYTHRADIHVHITHNTDIDMPHRDIRTIYIHTQYVHTERKIETFICTYHTQRYIDTCTHSAHRNKTGVPH